MNFPPENAGELAQLVVQGTMGLYFLNAMRLKYISPVLNKVFKFDQRRVLNEHLQKLYKEYDILQGKFDSLSEMSKRDKAELNRLSDENKYLSVVIESAAFYHHNEYLIDEYNIEERRHERHTSLPWLDNDDERYSLEQAIPEDTKWLKSLQRRGYKVTLWTYVKRPQSQLKKVGLKPVEHDAKTRNNNRRNRRNKGDNKEQRAPIRLPEQKTVEVAKVNVR